MDFLVTLMIATTSNDAVLTYLQTYEAFSYSNTATAALYVEWTDQLLHKSLTKAIRTILINEIETRNQNHYIPSNIDLITFE